MNQIQKIEVIGLWGQYDIKWSLQNNVSILAGGNGTGKSTLLRAVASMLTKGKIDEASADLFTELRVTLSNGNIISSTTLHEQQTFHNHLFANFLPWGNPAFISRDTTLCEMIDELLEVSQKRVVRNAEQLEFELYTGKRLGYGSLSSGEKEIIRLFAMAATTSDGDIIILDEPELSLHFDWQKTLIEDLLLLGASDLQLIISTHSPAIVMQGWMANISQIESLTTKGE